MNRSTEPLALRARCLIDEGAGADADASVMMNDGFPRAWNFAMTVARNVVTRVEFCGYRASRGDDNTIYLHTNRTTFERTSPLHTQPHARVVIRCGYKYPARKDLIFPHARPSTRKNFHNSGPGYVDFRENFHNFILVKKTLLLPPENPAV
jgi:hypothetical protein